MSTIGKSLLLTALLLPFLLVAWVPARAQQLAPAPVSAEVSLDKSHSTIGDPVALTITIRYPAGAQIGVDSLADQFVPFEVLNADPPADQKSANGSGEMKLRFKVAAYQHGTDRLPWSRHPIPRIGQRGHCPDTAHSVHG